MIKDKNLRKVKTRINRAKKILLCLHQRSDPDSIGSNFALYNWFKSRQKKVALNTENIERVVKEIQRRVAEKLEESAYL